MLFWSVYDIITHVSGRHLSTVFILPLLGAGAFFVITKGVIMQKVSYVGNGETTEFYFNFPYFEDNNIVVSVNNGAAPAYNIVGTSGGENADFPFICGKVVFEVAPRALDCIVIARQLPMARVADYQPLAQINPTTLNQDMNYLMEVLKDFNDKLETFSTQYAEIVDKESTQNLITKIDNVTEKIDDFDDEIENGRIMSMDDFYSYSTNCLVNVPHNINIELNNGTLTLKAGSKVYIPNGVGVFDVVTVQSDLSITGSTGDYSGTLFLRDAGDLVGYSAAANASGTTAPSGSANFYNTSTNTINRYNNGVKNSSLLSLPLCRFTVTSGTIVSVDQVFNGFGYIGSVLYVLPGVTCLIPNGKNTDGSLNNQKRTVASVKITTVSGTGSNIMIRLSETSIQIGDLQYNGAFNYNYISSYSQSNIRAFAVVGTITYASDVITSAAFKNTLVLSLA